MLSQILISIIGFIIAIGILVTIHEFGHFWVARLFGIKVLRFSIGFGRPFFRWYDKLGTEYVLSVLPLGGYVALLGERGNDISESERHMAFSYKSVWVRMAVLAAGPLFNLGFAIFAYWLMFMIGISSLAPILGTVPAKTAAEMAGLHRNQEIVAIEDKPTPNWEAVSVSLIKEIGENRMVNISVKEGTSATKTQALDVSGLEQLAQDGDILKDLGLVPLDPIPPVVGQLLSGHPAELAGIKVGDKILAINDQPVQSRSEANESIQSKASKNITIKIKRGEEIKTISLQPMAKQNEDGKEIGFIGILYSTTEKPPAEFVRTLRYGPINAFAEASKRTWNYTVLTLEMLKKMVLGKMSVKHLSGPVAIAQYAGHSVVSGLEYFLSFLAVVSISLGVLNLLPIPLLDGGQIFYCLWEVVTGRKVSENIQNVGIWLGGIVLLSFMILAFYNDLSKF